MYDVFDNFLKIDTWHTTHPLDTERFDKCLKKIVQHQGFDSSRMGDYFYDKIDEGNSNHTEAIKRYVVRADVIHDYMLNTEN